MKTIQGKYARNRSQDLSSTYRDVKIVNLLISSLDIIGKLFDSIKQMCNDLTIDKKQLNNSKINHYNNSYHVLYFLHA